MDCSKYGTLVHLRNSAGLMLILLHKWYSYTGIKPTHTDHRVTTHWLLSGNKTEVVLQEYDNTEIHESKTSVFICFVFLN